MQTLKEIISDLTKIAKDNNYEGATIDALIYMLASGIYKNQLNVINTSLEMSPSMCSLTNSAIQHAQDKNYSVYRGKNQHIYLRYVIPNETKSVKKYDVCTKIGSYKLVYAHDYKFESGVNLGTTELELILCKELIEETLVSSLRKYVRSSSTNLTEDLDFYIDDESVKYTDNINIGLNSENYLNQTCNTPYLILTDTDFGVICWCYDRLQPDLIFDTNYVYKIKSPEYLDEEIDPLIIKTIPGFDITHTLENTVDKNGKPIGEEDGITSDQRLDRETDTSNIYIQSSSALHSGNIIRSVDDIKSIFINYFSKINIVSCKVYFETVDNIDYIKIVYLLKDKNKAISSIDIEEFEKYLSKAYYVTQKIDIQKAWAYRPDNLNEPYRYKDITKTTRTVIFQYDTDTIKRNIEYKNQTVGDYIELPLNAFKKENKRFLGWTLNSPTVANNYAITGLNDKPAKYLIPPAGQDNLPLTFYMVWEDEDSTNVYNNVDLYFEYTGLETLSIDNFYQRIVCLSNTVGTTVINPKKENYSFAKWIDHSLKSRVSNIVSSDSVLTDKVYVGSWQSVSYLVRLYLTNEEIYKQAGFDSKNNDTIVKNINVLSGKSLDIVLSDITPSDMSGAGFTLTGFYWCSRYNNGIGDKDLPRYKFDLGTEIKENLELVAMYKQEKDLKLNIFFESPLNNSEIHNFIDTYSYNIGETFEPMKITTQLSKKFDGISWIDLLSSKQSISGIPRNAYFDFDYEVSFDNTL